MTTIFANIKVAYFLLGICVLFQWSCNKLDVQINSNQSEVVQKFLKIPDNVDPAIVRVVNDLRVKNDLKPFIEELVKNEGYPMWDKAEIKLQKNLTRRDGEGDTTILVPFLLVDANFVKSFLDCKLESSNIWYKLFAGEDYLSYGWNKETSRLEPNAEDVARMIMKFESSIFGADIFKIFDNKLFDYTDSARPETFFVQRAMVEMPVNIPGLYCEQWFETILIDGVWYDTGVTWWECEISNAPGGGGSGWVGWDDWDEGGGWGSTPSTGGGGSSGTTLCPRGWFRVPLPGSGQSIPITPCGDEPVPQPTTLADQIWQTNQIKDSSGNPCIASTLTALRSLSSKLPALMRTVFDSTVVANFNVTFKTQNYGHGNWGAITDPNYDNNNFKVTLNTYYDNATNLGVAATIIHEIFHCQLMDWYRRAYLEHDSATIQHLALNYGYLFSKEIINFDSSLAAIIFGANGASMHQDIAVRYRNTIGETLYQYALSQGISITLAECKELALTGCTDSPYFAALPNNDEINDKIKAEKDPYGATINYPLVTPKGTPCL